MATPVLELWFFPRPAIAVRERREVAGFGTWTTRAGMQHVEPPAELLARMVTLRLHLDNVDEANALLLVAAGSHRLGRIAEGEIDAAVERLGTGRAWPSAGCVGLLEAGSSRLRHGGPPAPPPRAAGRLVSGRTDRRPGVARV